MARAFTIPPYYRSSMVSSIKNARKSSDSRKRDRSPSVLDCGVVQFKIARHFGFCFGVENAIEIAYRALQENPNKRVFLLSEMIHNPQVNGDLMARGVRFILSPEGTQLFPFEELRPEDIVIVPAFGTTVELFNKLSSLGINPTRYNATCPFVEKVWKRAEQLGQRGYTVIIHGKQSHEETRATFSHARLGAPSLVIRDRVEAQTLARYIRGESSIDDFFRDFEGRASEGFLPNSDLSRIGVVNQTTMLATETQEISELLREAMRSRYGEEDLEKHFADTRDTLCYATTENQEATSGLIDSGGDLAIVVGGYNSSNTSHLYELLSARYPTYYIKDAGEIISAEEIRHLDFPRSDVIVSQGWLLKQDRPLEILLTAGASCPDALVDKVLSRVAELCGVSERLSRAIVPFENSGADSGVIGL